ncbi:MAG: sortase family protein LPXTG-site transpeptidase [Acidimicrobiales bacterium]|nr:sortase family protein LPXTG-site transpeptidase [Acidimicrobiales bacterium]
MQQGYRRPSSPTKVTSAAVGRQLGSRRRASADRLACRAVVSRVLGGIGRTLIAAGVIILLFVAYEVWGTNLQEAKAQRKLNREFTATLQQATTTTNPTTTSRTTSTTRPGAPAPPTTDAPQPAPINLPVPPDGSPLARIEIPKISVDKTVVQGVTVDQLKRGPGHYPGTALPGQNGNAAIAGHRTTYGAPFHNIDKLVVGDDIKITTTYGTFRYKVVSSIIVSPSAGEVLNDRGDARLTLTACHPKYSASKRIVIGAVLVGKPVGKLKGQDEFQRKHQKIASQGSSAVIDGGLSGIQESKTPTLAWGALAALVWLVTWLASFVLQRRGAGRPIRWAPYVVGTPVFLLVLYVFFENFSLLLPSNF